VPRMLHLGRVPRTSGVAVTREGEIRPAALSLAARALLPEAVPSPANPISSQVPRPARVPRPWPRPGRPPSRVPAVPGARRPGCPPSRVPAVPGARRPGCPPSRVPAVPGAPPARAPPADPRPSRRGRPVNPTRLNLWVSVESSHESVTDFVNSGSVKTRTDLLTTHAAGGTFSNAQ
jgi:hypothetical protein